MHMFLRRKNFFRQIKQTAYCFTFLHLFCKVQYDDGDQYAGEWNDAGKRHGFGVLTFADGSYITLLRLI